MRDNNEGLLDVVYLAQDDSCCGDDCGEPFDTKEEAIEFADKTPSIVRILAVDRSTGEKEVV